MLQTLSGNTHKVYTGICLIDTKTGKTVGGSSVCEVTFPKLKEREIEEYLDSGEPFDKAGAYGIQGRGALLVDHIEGDYYTCLLYTSIKANLTFSMALNFVAIILAISGILNPVVGALVHNAGSVLVIINSSLLLKWRKK